MGCCTAKRVTMTIFDVNIHYFFSDKPPGLPPSATSYTTSTRNQAGFSAVSTASSVVSIANLHFLPVKTQTTLKSPLEGHNLGPFHKPEEFLGRAMDNLTHEDWETNVNGMADKFKITFFFAFFSIKNLLN